MNLPMTARIKPPDPGDVRAGNGLVDLPRVGPKGRAVARQGEHAAGRVVGGQQVGQGVAGSGMELMGAAGHGGRGPGRIPGPAAMPVAVVADLPAKLWVSVSGVVLRLPVRPQSPCRWGQESGRRVATG